MFVALDPVEVLDEERLLPRLLRGSSFEENVEFFVVGPRTRLYPRVDGRGGGRAAIGDDLPERLRGERRPPTALG